jgi:ankyrin repeat protein
MGDTALIGASWNGHKEVVKLLIEAGADVNAQDNWGHTALKFVSENGYTEVVNLLIEAGAK